MKLNTITPAIHVVPTQTYEVFVDGQLLTCEPAQVLPMAQGIFVLGGWPSCKMGGRPLPSQSSRVLKQWMDNGKLVGVGSGTYAKARPSSLSDQPVPRETLEVLPAEAFDHLGLAWKLGADAYK